MLAVISYEKLIMFFVCYCLKKDCYNLLSNLKIMMRGIEEDQKKKEKGQQ